MASQPEGLFYCVTRWSRSALPANATEEQIFDEFVNFNLQGVKDANGNYLQALDGSGAMNGTINWLAAYGIYDAKFYKTNSPAWLFFVSLDDASNPWSQNPGFMEFVQPVTVDLSQGPISLEPIPTLDNELASRRPS
jgi:hypothetical protein